MLTGISPPIKEFNTPYPAVHKYNQVEENIKLYLETIKNIEQEHSTIKEVSASLRKEKQAVEDFYKSIPPEETEKLPLSFLRNLEGVCRTLHHDRIRGYTSDLRNLSRRKAEYREVVKNLEGEKKAYVEELKSITPVKKGNVISLKDIIKALEHLPYINAQGISLQKVYSGNRVTLRVPFRQIKLTVDHTNGDNISFAKPASEEIPMPDVYVFIHTSEESGLFQSPTSSNYTIKSIDGKATRNFYSGESCHPHVLETRPCLGGYGPGISDALKNHDWVSFAVTMYSFLCSAATSDAAGRRWPSVFPRHKRGEVLSTLKNTFLDLHPEYINNTNELNTILIRSFCSGQEIAVDTRLSFDNFADGGRKAFIIYDHAKAYGVYLMHNGSDTPFGEWGLQFTDPVEIDPNELNVLENREGIRLPKILNLFGF